MDLTLMDDLKQAGYEPTPMRPKGFGMTVKEYMTEKNCTEAAARTVLDTAKEAGALDLHMMTETHRPGVVGVYHRPGDWPPK
jgi:hypothetical protein